MFFSDIALFSLVISALSCILLPWNRKQSPINTTEPEQVPFYSRKSVSFVLHSRKFKSVSCELHSRKLVLCKLQSRKSVSCTLHSRKSVSCTLNSRKSVSCTLHSRKSVSFTLPIWKSVLCTLHSRHGLRNTAYRDDYTDYTVSWKFPITRILT